MFASNSLYYELQNKICMTHDINIVLISNDSIDTTDWQTY